MGQIEGIRRRVSVMTREHSQIGMQKLRKQITTNNGSRRLLGPSCSLPFALSTPRSCSITFLVRAPAQPKRRHDQAHISSNISSLNNIFHRAFRPLTQTRAYTAGELWRQLSAVPPRRTKRLSMRFYTKKPHKATPGLPELCFVARYVHRLPALPHEVLEAQTLSLYRSHSSPLGLLILLFNPASVQMLSAEGAHRLYLIRSVRWHQQSHLGAREDLCSTWEATTTAIRTRSIHAAAKLAFGCPWTLRK